MPADPVTTRIHQEIENANSALVALQRDLHAHPELSWQEERTAGLVEQQLLALGLQPRRLAGTGVVADIVPAGFQRADQLVALRADLDALPVSDETGVAWSSTVDGVAHACGHDVHTAALIGAAMGLAQVRDQLPGPVRLVFQPAEEAMPGGALEMVTAGALDGVGRIFMLHCDPSVDAGQVGLRVGPMTGAVDSLDVTFSGRGGHTSRPHQSDDVVFAMGTVITQLPGVLSRRFDPRAGVSVVWGTSQAGLARNVIPSRGRLGGTVRMLDVESWRDAAPLITEAIEQLVSPLGVEVDVQYVPGSPPVVNDPISTAIMRQAIGHSVGAEHCVSTQQSLGGEDFAWYLEHVPGAMARLGTRTPGGHTFDLHQGDLRIDDAAIAVGAKVLATAAIVAHRSEVASHKATP